MGRGLAVALLACLVCVGGAGAHPADVTHLLATVERQNVEVRLTFNLLTLMRFLPMDGDQNGELSLEELKLAEPKIADYLAEHVPVSLNGGDGDRLSPMISMRPVWPTLETPVVKAEDYDKRWVDIVFDLPSEALVTEFWIGFEIFEDTGYAHTIQGFFEQESGRLEVPFTVAEPEFLYDTGFEPETEENTVDEALVKSGAPSSLTWWVLLFGVLVLAAVATAVTKLKRGRRWGLDSVVW